MASDRESRRGTTRIVWIYGSRGLDSVLPHTTSPGIRSKVIMFDDAPNGYFVRDLIVFNGLRQGCFVSKGFIFEPPDLDNAQVSDLNEFQDQISLLLASRGWRWPSCCWKPDCAACPMNSAGWPL